MHEHSLMKAIVDRVIRATDDPVTLVTLRAGEMSGIAPEHLEEHFRLAARGTSLENVALRILSDPGSAVTLDSIEVDT